MEYIHRNIKTKYIFTTNLYKIQLNDSVLSNIGTWNIFHNFQGYYVCNRIIIVEAIVL